MVVIRKDEDEWWFAKHEDGRTGAIPVPYVEVVSLLCAVNEKVDDILLTALLLFRSKSSLY